MKRSDWLPLSHTRRTKREWFWKGCKPNFVFALASGENHLSQQPIPETCLAFTRRGASRSSVSYLALHPMGFSVPRRLRFERWSLTPPFHPYPELASGAVCSLWHFPSGRLTPSLPACIPAILARVTRHRALWCSDFPPPSRNAERKRFSALPKPEKLYVKPAAETSFGIETNSKKEKYIDRNSVRTIFRP